MCVRVSLPSTVVRVLPASECGCVHVFTCSGGGGGGGILSFTLNKGHNFTDSVDFSGSIDISGYVLFVWLWPRTLRTNNLQCFVGESLLEAVSILPVPAQDTFAFLSAHRPCSCHS